MDLNSASKPLTQLFNGESATLQLCSYELLKNFNSRFIYDKLEQGFFVYKAWPTEIMDYVLNKNVQPEISTTLSEKAFTIFVTVSSLTATYIFIRKLKKVFKKKQSQFKTIEENIRIDEEIKQQQLVAYSNRANSSGDITDKRKLCILCISNRRECVFLDCGHICVCVDCLKALPFPKTCPICRCQIVQTVLLLRS